MRRLAAVLIITGCTAVTPPPAPVTTVASQAPYGFTVEEEARILRLEDRREYDAALVQQWVHHPNALHRTRIALALGRIGPHTFIDVNGNGERDPNERQAGVEDLASLATDSDAKVRVAAAFALGQIGDSTTRETLLGLAADRESADVAAEAVEALSKMAAKIPLASYAKLTGADQREGVRARAIRYLFRFRSDEAMAIAANALDAPSAAIRQEAAYALARRAYAPARARLELLMGDATVLTRAYVARALGAIAAAESMPVLIYGLAVLALNILTGGSGQFSLGQSAFYAVGAYTSAILMEHVGMNYALTLPIAGLICFGFGFLFGQPALRLSGVYLALATFALATAMPQLLKLGFFEHWTGGVQGLVVTKPDAPFGLPMSQDMWLYYFTLAITIGIYIASVNLLRSRSGRAFMAIRDNEIAASAMGVDVALYKTLAFGVSAGITGIAGGLGAIAVQFVAPDGYTILLAISLFLGMVVGGVGWLPGSIVGSAFIIFVPNIAEGISKGLSGAVFGVLLFLVIFLVPHGARQVAMIAQQLIEKLKK